MAQTGAERSRLFRERHPKRVKVTMHRQNRRLEARFGAAKSNAERKNHTWDIEFSDYSNLLIQPCYYHGGKLSETGIGLDRLDNLRGYSLDNVVPCCGICNFVRGNKFTPTETLRLGVVIKEILEERGVSGIPIPHNLVRLGKSDVH